MYSGSCKNILKVDLQYVARDTLYEAEQKHTETFMNVFQRICFTCIYYVHT